jgi:chromate transporter
VAALFTRLGFTAFGGPAAHIALMEEEVVVRRKWVDRQHFLDMLAAVNFIPGPNSTEMAIHLGLIRAGYPGLVVAGVCFITPAVLIILPLAYLYVRFGTMPQVQPALRGISAAVVALVVMMTIRMLEPIRRDLPDLLLAIVSLAGVELLRRVPHVQPEITLLVAAAIFGIARAEMQKRRALPMLSLAAWPFVELGLFFLKVGATLFGSGYLLISYLQTGLVDSPRHWLTRTELLDAIAVGQFTPGPVLTTATFVGYLVGAKRFNGGTPGGILGAVVATLGIFLPAFLGIALLAPVLQRLRTMPTARAALDAMNAAVIGLVASAALHLGTAAFYDPADRRVEWANVVIAVAALAALWRKVNATWVILAAGMVGWLFHAARG